MLGYPHNPQLRVYPTKHRFGILGRFTRPGKHTKNYGTLPFFNIFLGTIHELNGDFPVRYVKLPEGSLLAQVDIQTLH